MLGGFAGAASLVADALEGKQPIELTFAEQVAENPDYEDTMTAYNELQPGNIPSIDYEEIVRELNDFGLAGLSAGNKLSDKENAILMRTGSLDVAIYYIMKGLEKVQEERSKR